MLYPVPRFFILFFCFFIASNACDGQEDDIMLHVQLTAAIGSPMQNIGVRVIGRYITESQLEFSAGYSLNQNFRSYGPEKSHLEHGLVASAHYTWGDDFIDTRTPEKSYIKYIDERSTSYAFGYTWERFINTIGTSQNVGTFSFRAEEYILTASNDVFANTDGKDRFRTGAFGFGYLEGADLFSTKILIWTGDTRCDGVEKYGNEDYPSRWGYRDISDCNYGKLSHGILSFGYHRLTDYGQMIGAELGMDSEHTRNLIQNKIFHDLYFIPNFMNNTKNRHLPMKMENGENYLYQDNQEVRATRFVWQIVGNGSLLY